MDKSGEMMMMILVRLRMKVAPDRNSLDPPPIKALRLIHLPVYNRGYQRMVILHQPDLEESGSCNASMVLGPQGYLFRTLLLRKNFWLMLYTVHFSCLNSCKFMVHKGRLFQLLMPTMFSCFDSCKISLGCALSSWRDSGGAGLLLSSSRPTGAHPPNMGLPIIAA